MMSLITKSNQIEIRHHEQKLMMISNRLRLLVMFVKILDSIGQANKNRCKPILKQKHKEPV